MRVVFYKDVEGTAQVGDVKDVKAGFARNFLLPRNLAGPETKDNVQHALALAEREKRVQAKLDSEAEVLAAPLVGYTVTVEARVGDSGRLFGSITTRDVAEALRKARDIEVDPHSVLLYEPIRELGARAVSIRFTRNVMAEITVDVVPDEESKAIVERLAAEAEVERLEAEKKAAEEAYLEQQEAERSGQNRAQQSEADPDEQTETDDETTVDDSAGDETAEDAAD